MSEFGQSGSLDHGRLPLPRQPWQDALQEERFLLEKYFHGQDQEGRPAMRDDVKIVMMA